VLSPHTEENVSAQRILGVPEGSFFDPQPTHRVDETVVPPMSPVQSEQSEAMTEEQKELARVRALAEQRRAERQQQQPSAAASTLEQMQQKLQMEEERHAAIQKLHHENFAAAAAEERARFEAAMANAMEKHRQETQLEDEKHKTQMAVAQAEIVEMANRLSEQVVLDGQEATTTEGDADGQEATTTEGDADGHEATTAEGTEAQSGMEEEFQRGYNEMARKLNSSLLEDGSKLTEADSVAATAAVGASAAEVFVAPSELQAAISAAMSEQLNRDAAGNVVADATPEAVSSIAQAVLRAMQQT